jgi:hypothetical protein
MIRGKPAPQTSMRKLIPAQHGSQFERLGCKRESAIFLDVPLRLQSLFAFHPESPAGRRAIRLSRENILKILPPDSSGNSRRGKQPCEIVWSEHCFPRAARLFSTASCSSFMRPPRHDRPICSQPCRGPVPMRGNTRIWSRVARVSTSHIRRRRFGKRFRSKAKNWRRNALYRVPQQ